MDVARLIFCTALAFASLFVFLYIKDKPYEIRAWKALIASIIGLKAACVYVLYTRFAALNTGSDAVQYYYPQAQKVLSGQIPYRDFASSYSYLFQLLFVPMLSLWHSLGAIVLTMLLFETGMIALYLGFSARPGSPTPWRVAFLYSCSPISFYWVAMTGYNGAIIAFFTMACLVFAQRRKSLYAAFFSVLGFLSSKLLMLLNFPAVIFYEFRGWERRALFAFSFLAISIVVPLAAGIDVLMPLRTEVVIRTSGNFWFLIMPFVREGARLDPAWYLLSLGSLAAAFSVLLVSFWRSKQQLSLNDFDSAAAFIAAVNLVFLILALKSYTMYLPMALIFVLHTVVVNARGRRDLLKGLVPVALLGATTTIEPILYHIVDGWKLSGPARTVAALWTIDLLVLACYAWLALFCYRASVARGTSEVERPAPLEKPARAAEERELEAAVR
jgi:hypothetical protein